MNDRIRRLREQSLKAQPTISAERASLLTASGRGAGAPPVDEITSCGGHGVAPGSSLSFPGLNPFHGAIIGSRQRRFQLPLVPARR